VTAPGGHDVACVIHVHSTFSDGTGTPGEIAAAARAAGADAVLLTDHDTLGALRAGCQGFHDGTLVLTGHEVTSRRGHLLVFGVDEEIGHAGRSEEQIAAEVARRGGLGIAAHPFSDGSRISRRIGRPHPWQALAAPGVDAIELWSLVTDGAERWHTPLDAFRFIADPEAVVDGPPPEHLAAWDELSARKRTPALGGLDAHQTGLRLAGGRILSPFPNVRWFRLLQTLVVLGEPLSGDLARDRATVLDAIRAGRCALVRPQLADARGFRLWAANGADTLPMGGEAPYREGWTLHARLPHPAEIRLLHDGRVTAAIDGETVEHRLEGPGVHRLEARLGGRTWIVSNPVHLR
jgi:hypothetical protein